MAKDWPNDYLSAVDFDRSTLPTAPALARRPLNQRSIQPAAFTEPLLLSSAPFKDLAAASTHKDGQQHQPVDAVVQRSTGDVTEGRQPVSAKRKALLSKRLRVKGISRDHRGQAVSLLEVDQDETVLATGGETIVLGDETGEQTLVVAEIRPKSVQLIDSSAHARKRGGERSKEVRRPVNGSFPA